MAKVLIDASNLFSGGAVQVAASFIADLQKILQTGDPRFPWLEDTVIFASHRVASELNEIRNVTVLDRRPSRALLSGRLIATNDVVFTVFGPRYARGIARRSVTGFADVTSIFPEIQAKVAAPGFHGRVRRGLSRMFCKRDDHLVVETTAMRNALVTRWGMEASRISVVPNTLSSQFTSSLGNLPPRDTSAKDDTRHLDLLYVTRPYPHKNIEFIGQLGRELQNLHFSMHTRVTLSKSEHLRLDTETQGFTTPIGVLDLAELAAEYSRSDAAIFPSLLEAFSATPLEAMAIGTPLIASDREFVRSICGDYPIYIDPLDPFGAAETIVKAWQMGELGPRSPEINAWSTADRTEGYLRVIDSQVRDVYAKV